MCLASFMRRSEHMELVWLGGGVLSVIGASGDADMISARDRIYRYRDFERPHCWGPCLLLCPDLVSKAFPVVDILAHSKAAETLFLKRRSAVRRRRWCTENCAVRHHHTAPPQLLHNNLTIIRSATTEASPNDNLVGSRNMMSCMRKVVSTKIISES